ncbi:multiubiquitin domain-containing protein [Flagellimonas amoyensis]|uniref:multiubiquitin domain-containing protein n=1 Tax=Flagellimonas amoyensis TaxID=2169401 RepID=UPI00131F3526|nr:multiubiquitin domain-containing protein [Allomuricauda amoyensis]
MKAEKKQNQERKLYLKFLIQEIEYNWYDQFITGEQLKNLAGINIEEELFLSLVDPWDDELISNDTKVDLARPGIEKFYVRPLLKFKIDNKMVSWNEQFITGLQIKNLGSLSDDEQVFLKIKGDFEDEIILNNAKVDLARPGIENFYSKKAIPALVSIFIDTKPYELERGKYTGSELKGIGGVPIDYELEQIVHGQIKLISDNKMIVIKGGEEFISHPKDGHSS